MATSAQHPQGLVRSRKLWEAGNNGTGRWHPDRHRCIE